MGGGKPILVVRPAAERQGDAAVGTAVIFRFPTVSIILYTAIPAVFNLKIDHVMFVRAHVLHIPQQRKPPVQPHSASAVKINLLITGHVNIIVVHLGDIFRQLPVRHLVAVFLIIQNFAPGCILFIHRTLAARGRFFLRPILFLRSSFLPDPQFLITFQMIIPITAQPAGGMVNAPVVPRKRLLVDFPEIQKFVPFSFFF